MANVQLERGLAASVQVYEFARDKLVHASAGGEGDGDGVGDGDEEKVVVSKAELTKLKKSGARMNRALTSLVRNAFDESNRLTLELHMLRGIMKRELTDRDANRARVFELFRRYSGDDDSTIASANSSMPSLNPLNAPSASAIAVDKALAGLERIEQSINDISPVGRVNIHGSGLISAKAKLDALSVVVDEKKL